MAYLTDSQEILAWLALDLAHGMGHRSIERLVRRFGSASGVWSASRHELSAVSGVSSTALDALRNGPDMRQAEKAARILEDSGSWIMTFLDEDYPLKLSAIPDFPAILYGKGDRKALSAAAVAIVGSRAASSYGRRAAAVIASGLASKGICVVSGLALGIDSASHRACLDAGGITVAVKGCGININYPVRNRELEQHISEGGAVITEFPPDAAPEPRNFPRRNRIISGLSAGVVVIEASLKSGSLITASTALEQGREVMAVPGSIFSFNSAGTHWLIRQGAALVADANEVVDSLGRQLHLVQESPDDSGESAVNVEEDSAGEGQHVEVAGLSGKEQNLYENIENEPLHIDELCAISGLSAGEAAALLVQLELKGLVEALPGQMYQKSH